MKGGRPTLVLNLGDRPVFLSAPVNVRDGRWHRLTAERTGKLLRLRVETEGAEAVESETPSSGSKSLLNLHQEQSRLYVGGVPTSFRVTRGADWLASSFQMSSTLIGWLASWSCRLLYLLKHRDMSHNTTIP